MGRKAIHGSPADRLAAHRAKFSRVEIRLDPDTAQTIEEIATALGYSRTEVIESMLKFALTNRDWKRFGLAHARKAGS